ncbi:uncharacterized protein LOC121728599 [Aricia agestis]|uniref:uncharacterized protein LOC121728599 n=1 Tax=Aricia agestis TaxID=91739 RepID=UPI001C204158|nr:uncharacterized protein LOC121728599 [Aricia agestis]
MKGFLLLFLVGIAAAAPATKENDSYVMVIDGNFYRSERIKYKSNHDIVSILVPFNSLYFNRDVPSESNPKEKVMDLVLFFTEADVSEDGIKSYKGVSVMKKNKVTKLLENGKDMAASGDNGKVVFIGASDGLYVYNDEQTAVEKFGSISDDVIGIAKQEYGDAIYILTAKKEVHKVTEKGNTKEKIDDIVDAEQIMLDYNNNLYFYSSDKQVKICTTEGIKKVDGLPENPTNVQLIKPAFVMRDFVPVVVDDSVYIIYTNGTSAKAGIDFKEAKYRPTAYSMEGTIVQYYAYNKTIYEYNMLDIVSGSGMDETKTFLDNKNITIQDLITIKHRH